MLCLQRELNGQLKVKGGGVSLVAKKGLLHLLGQRSLTFLV